LAYIDGVIKLKSKKYQKICLATLNRGRFIKILCLGPINYFSFLKFVPDWWIYGTICIAAGILNIFANADCPFWRFLASTVIVLGTIETFIFHLKNSFKINK